MVDSCLSTTVIWCQEISLELNLEINRGLMTNHLCGFFFFYNKSNFYSDCCHNVITVTETLPSLELGLLEAISYSVARVENRNMRGN